MLKPIRIISERDKMALWAVFEYMAHQPDHIVEGYQEELQVIADMMGISEEKYEKETGLSWDFEHNEEVDIYE